MTHSIPGKMEFSLRPAQVEDNAMIQRLIRQEHLNPSRIDWPRFVVAVDRQGSIIGCGQVKIHSSQVRELASLVVVKDWRGKGVARALITTLIAQHPGELYLACRAGLEPLYQRFGFKSIPPSELPANYRRMVHLVNLILTLLGRRGGFKVMRRPA